MKNETMKLYVKPMVLWDKNGQIEQLLMVDLWINESKVDNHIKISKNKLETNYVTSYIWHSNNFTHLILTKLLMEKLVPSPCMP